MAVRGVRGAHVAIEDRPEAILQATQELLQAILDANPTLKPQDLASAFFTMTTDLSSAYPAQAARQMGWQFVPMMCSTEIPVPDSPAHCIRVLLLWNTELPQEEIRHIYLGEARRLRPDLITGEEGLDIPRKKKL